LDQHVFVEFPDDKTVWVNHLMPLVKESRFPLVVWEPQGADDSYRISHLSFQEYYCAVGT
jgi:serine protease inhibitor ecotin